MIVTDENIERVARKMCSALMVDPDQQVFLGPPVQTPLPHCYSPAGPSYPAWTRLAGAARAALLEATHIIDGEAGE